VRYPLVIVAVLVSSCGDSGSPTQPVAPPPAATPTGIVIQDGAGRLTEHHALIRMLVEQTLAQASAALGIDPGSVAITVTGDASRSIAGYGVGGFAPNGRAIEIHINPDFPDLETILRERVPLTVAHELHHATRWRGPGYGSTLLEWMISEGLADHFAVELLGVPLPPWSRAFPESETSAFLAQARPELDSTRFDSGAWFFGTRADLPRWTGYTLGYRLVENYQAANPGSSAADLVNTPADAFRPA